MGLTAIVSTVASAASSSASAGAGVVSMTTTVGTGIGGIFVAASLIYLLAYLDLFDASGETDPEVRRTIVATILPLLIVFAGIVTFQTLQLL